MRFIRRVVYRMGFRPKLGSLFYSPSADFIYAHRDYIKKYGESPFLRGFHQGMDGAIVSKAFDEREEDQL